MKNVKVSIIIPAYNAEDSISRCIESVLGQTLPEIEVIVVDDGSVDDTREQCKKYENDQRFHYYYKENGGVSSARNYGISKSTGEFVGFVDSDDTVADNMYERMYKMGTENIADICICDMNRLKPSGDIMQYTDFVRGGIFDKDEIVKEILPHCLAFVDNAGNIVRIDWCVLRRIFRKSFLSSHNIMFDESLSNSEDCMFVFTATFWANKIVYLKDEYLYNNIINSNSLTKRYLPDYWEQRCRIIDKVKKISTDNSVLLNSDMMNLFVLRCVRPSFENISLGFSNNSNIKSFFDYKKIINNKNVRNAVLNVDDKTLGYEWSRMVRWIKNKEVLSIFLYYKDIFGKSKICHCIRQPLKKFDRLMNKRQQYR